MRHYIYCTLCSVLLLFNACDKQETLMSGVGYFALNQLDLSCGEEIIPLTRAVDTHLYIQLWQGSTLVKEYAPGSDLSKRVALPVGDYTLKAFTPGEAEAPDNEPGIPIYRIAQNFMVGEADITTLSLVVPQVNVGVFVGYDPLFLSAFRNISLQISSVSGRTVTVNGTEDRALRYFNLPSDGILSYQLSATNADGEVFTMTRQLAPVTARNYHLNVGAP